jgi:acetyl-CoA synthetase
MGDFDYKKDYENWKWDVPEYIKKGYDAGEELQMDIKRPKMENAAPYKYPSEIGFVNKLPKTQSGKIKRKLLKEAEIKKKKE